MVAATLGFRVAEGATADVSIGYGPDADVLLEPGLALRAPQVPAPKPTMVSTPSGEQLPVFHPSGSGVIDHLAEIFEWTSGLHELSVTERDSVGRIPSQHTLPIAAGLDPTVAWASRVIDDLSNSMVAVKPRLASTLTDRSTVPTVSVSHDLDFYCRGPQDVLNRLGRSLVAAGRRRDRATMQRTLFHALRRPHRLPRLLDTVDDLLELDRAHGVEASWVIIPRKAHRRDANYEFADIQDLLVKLDQMADLAVHGSYTSLDQPNGLADEYEVMRSAGFAVTGGRQHWLRFADHKLFHSLDQADASWDSSVAYSDRVGFRHGMASPYRMWDPTNERPLPTLQIPLVMMDMALDAMNRAGENWEAPARNVLAELERSPAAAASVLWHDTVFSGVQTDPEIVDFYRTVIARPYRWRSLSAVADERA